MSVDPSQFYQVLYPNEQIYNISRRTDAIVWTYAVVLGIAIYDWLVSLDMEYKRIWKRDFSIISFLYLGSRYYSLFVMAYLTVMYIPEIHTFAFCEKAFRWACGLTIPIEMFSGGILLLRSYAFTGRRRSYLVIFLTLYILMISYMIVVTCIALEVIPFLRIGQVYGRCITAGLSTNQVATGFWVAPLGFCIILTAVTMVESLRLRNRMPSASRSPLFKVFVRDGLLYLLVITITNVTNVVFFAQQDATLKGSGMAFQFLFSSLMSCRLVLSLRDSEATAFKSAAASIATRSMWKTGVAEACSHEEEGKYRSQRSVASAEDDLEKAQAGALDAERVEMPVLNHTAVRVVIDTATQIDDGSEKQSFDKPRRF